MEATYRSQITFKSDEREKAFYTIIEKVSALSEINKLIPKGFSTGLNKDNAAVSLNAEGKSLGIQLLQVLESATIMPLPPERLNPKFCSTKNET